VVVASVVLEEAALEEAEQAAVGNLVKY